MCLVIVSCSVDYSGRLDAHLSRATRVLMFRVDGSALVHSGGGPYKSLSWVSAPTRPAVIKPDEEAAADGVRKVWEVSTTKTDDRSATRLFETIFDIGHELGMDPGFTKNGVEAHLQELLTEQIEVPDAGYRLVRREFLTAIGPVDTMAKDVEGRSVVVEVKRVGGIDGVEQPTRYLELLDRNPLLTPVQGVSAVQIIKPQARVLAENRGIHCVTLSYDVMRGMDDPGSCLF